MTGIPKFEIANHLLSLCLTGDHLVLTRSGWRLLADIHRVCQDAASPVVEVCSFNLTASAMEWKPVTDAQRFPAGEQRLFRMQGDGMDVVATKDHRMLTGHLCDHKLTAGSFDFETVEQLVGARYGASSTTTGTNPLAYSRTHAVVRSAATRQPAFKLPIKDLDATCDWWWERDDQRAFLRFVGFWLGDGHLVVALGWVGLSQRKLASSAWLIDLLDEVFPRWWRRSRAEVDEQGTTFTYIIRCPPLYEYLRLMAVGPPGYNPLDPAELRAYPHFKYEEELVTKEAASAYGPYQAGSTWTEEAMLAAFRRGPVRRPCCVCSKSDGVRLVCSGAGCSDADDITRAHPICVGRADDAKAHVKPWYCQKSQCQLDAPPSDAQPASSSSPAKKPSRPTSAATTESEEEVEASDVEEVMPGQHTTKSGRVSSAPARYDPASKEEVSAEESEEESVVDEMAKPVPTSNTLSSRVASAPPSLQPRAVASRAAGSAARRSSISSSSDSSSRRRSSVSLSAAGDPNVGQGVAKRRRSSAASDATCAICEPEACDCFEMADGGDDDELPAAMSGDEADANAEADDDVQQVTMELPDGTITMVTDHDVRPMEEDEEVKDQPAIDWDALLKQIPAGEAVARAHVKKAREEEAAGNPVYHFRVAPAHLQVWNGGLFVIINGAWFYIKRWMGPDVADTIANLSQPQAVALLEGFCRADDNWSQIEYDDNGEPTGCWECSSSSFPLIDHLQLVGQLAGAAVGLALGTKAGRSTRIGGRTVTFKVDHWRLTLNFGKTYGAKEVSLSLLAQPVDVSDNIKARGHYNYVGDDHVYDITVEGNGNFLTQRLSMGRVRGGVEAVRAQPVFVGNCHPKVAVVLKRPNNKKLDDSHQFMLNAQYKNALKKVNVPLLRAVESEDSGEEENKAIELQRRHQMDAAIVRIMKTRKTLRHNLLVAEVIQQLSARFKPKPNDIKKRIEALIEQDYMERDKDDRGTYSYLA